MKVVVTGATGFLGRALVHHLLREGHEVDALVRAAERAQDLSSAGARVIVAADAVAAGSAIAASGADAVAHLATHYLKAHTLDDIPALMRANVEFGTGILDAAAATQTPVVLASSFFQFRGGSVHPASLYAASKQALSVVAAYYADRGLPVREVVLYDTYGPGDTRDKLVPLLVEGARTAAPVRLGSPDQPINLCFVDDVVRGMATLLSTDAPAMTTIRAPRAVTVREVAEAVAAAADRPLDIIFRADAPVNDLPLMAGDWPTPPGWGPAHTLAEGMRLTLSGAAGSRAH